MRACVCARARVCVCVREAIPRLCSLCIRAVHCHGPSGPHPALPWPPPNASTRAVCCCERLQQLSKSQAGHGRLAPSVSTSPRIHTSSAYTYHGVSLRLHGHTNEPQNHGIHAATPPVLCAAARPPSSCLKARRIIAAFRRVPLGSRSSRPSSRGSRLYGHSCVRWWRWC